MNGLYLENGYLNVSKILSSETPFNFIVGGRGTGKTYGALSECIDRSEKFFFIRRTQAQADIISRKEFSPFKRICADRNIKITSVPVTKYNSAFTYYHEDEDGKIVVDGSPIGYSAALSTFSNIRGFDASDVELIIFDEFIPERHERPIKNEYEALMNCYETINRNRELEGRAPVRLLCLANANDVANPVFIGFDLVKKADEMVRKNKEIYVDSKRGISLYMLQKSPVSEEKRNTALYRATVGTRFSEMSLGNKFSFNDTGNIKSMPLREFIPLCSISKISIYKHKAKQIYYVSRHSSGSPEYYSDSESDIERFRRKFGWLWDAYLCQKIIFEEYLCETLLTKYLRGR